jgi:hypothetical protein
MAPEADGDDAARQRAHEHRPAAIGLGHDPAAPMSSAPLDHCTTATKHITLICPVLR